MKLSIDIEKTDKKNIFNISAALDDMTEIEYEYLQTIHIEGFSLMLCPAEEDGLYFDYFIEFKDIDIDSLNFYKKQIKEIYKKIQKLCK